MRIGRPRDRAEALGIAALGIAGIAALLQSIGLLAWPAQIMLFRLAGPPVMLVTALLNWHVASRATLPAVRRHWRLMAATAALVTASYISMLAFTVYWGTPRYPTHLPAVTALDVSAIVMAVIAVLAIPAAVPWSASRLRVGLDMATVLLASTVFLWHFCIGPDLQDHTTITQVLAMLALGAGALTAVFAAARVFLAGVAGIDRRAILTLAGAGLAEVATEALRWRVSDPNPRVHPALVCAALFRVCMVAYPVAQLRAQASEADHQRPERPRRPFSILPYTAIAATYALLIASLAKNMVGRTWVVLGGTIVLTGLVVARQIVALRDNAHLVIRLDDSLNRLGRMIAREQTLASASTTLLTQRSQQEIWRFAASTAMELMSDQPGVLAAVIVPASGASGSWRVASATGHRAESLPRSAFEPPRAFGLLIPRLRIGEVIEDFDFPQICGEDAGSGDADGRPPWPGYPASTTTLLPLMAGDQFFGVLIAVSAAALPGEVRESLNTLRIQVALALASAALAQEMTRRATLDPLTGLGNRTLLWDRLSQALASGPAPNGRRTALLLLDLDGFKEINDTFGHATGDEVLRLVSERLGRCCDSPMTTVVRLGGDEFVVLVERTAGVGPVSSLAERIIAAITLPMPVCGRMVSIGVSVGVALSGPDVHLPDDLLRHADTAMYVAKRRPGSGYTVQGSEILDMTESVVSPAVIPSRNGGTADAARERSGR
ncbi:MAG: GGDEF domain-containing protein [Micromonosporaceae bacterium]|nr:GGDEF domain-containing protein [Micromonosporaceae bacterium]